MKVLIVSLSVLLCTSAQHSLPEVPGLEAWQAALAAHSALEGQKVDDVKNSNLPQSLLNIPGLEEWKQHQLDAKRAEALLEKQKALVQASFLLEEMTASLESPRTSGASSKSTLNAINSIDVPKTASIVTNFIEKIKNERQKANSEELEELSEVINQQKKVEATTETTTTSFYDYESDKLPFGEDSSLSFLSKLLDRMEVEEKEQEKFRISSNKKDDDEIFSLSKLLDNLEATVAVEDKEPVGFGISSNKKDDDEIFSLSKLLDNLEATVAVEDKEPVDFGISSNKKDDDEIFSLSKFLDNLEATVADEQKDPDDFRKTSNEKENDELFSLSKFLDELEEKAAVEEKESDDFRIYSNEKQNDGLFFITKLIDNLEATVTDKEKEPESFRKSSNENENKGLFSSLLDLLQGNISKENRKPKIKFESLHNFNKEIEEAIEETKRIDRQLTALLDDLDYY